MPAKATATPRARVIEVHLTADDDRIASKRDTGEIAVYYPYYPEPALTMLAGMGERRAPSVRLTAAEAIELGRALISAGHQLNPTAG